MAFVSQLFLVVEEVEEEGVAVEEREGEEGGDRIHLTLAQHYIIHPPHIYSLSNNSKNLGMNISFLQKSRSKGIV